MQTEHMLLIILTMHGEPFDIELLQCSNDDYKKPISIGDLKYFFATFFFA